MKFLQKLFPLMLALFVLQGMQMLTAQDVLSPTDLLGLKSSRVLDLHPDGSEILYSISTPRTANEAPGPNHVAYFKMKLADKTSSPLFAEGVKASSPKYSPDGRMIAFIYAKEQEKRQVWAMPAEGGGMVQLTKASNGVTAFVWQPGGKAVAYLSPTPKTGRELELEKRGYGFIFYEENLKNTNLFLVELDEDLQQVKEKQLTKDLHVYDMEFSNDGNRIAFSASKKNLIDHRYMFRKIYLMNLDGSGELFDVGNVGKLGNYIFSPDSKKLAYTGALNINDHAVSQVYMFDPENGTTTNFTPRDFRGHYIGVHWKSDDELLCFSGEGVYPKLSLIDIGTKKREVILDAADHGVIFNMPRFSADFKTVVFDGSTPNDMRNIYVWDGEGNPEKISDINPDLAERALGKQEVIRYKARDGMEIEGLLMYPVGYEPGKKYPLILYVHGGPESHHSNGWLSNYATPGQVMAGKGYLVAYINYRASTGYGVDFGMAGFMDPAGKEFDDLADAIDYLVQEMGADPERVGMAGGSYGGYASAWFATYYTSYVKAVCMFVGISNLISKRGTTDIPYEEMYVHSGQPLEKQWLMNLERSPVYWAHQSKTATLIYGGAADTRVHPSQSKELYRRMKMNHHPAVRLVQYPGEGHGNRKQVGRIDVLLRQIDWLDWYVKDLKPLDGPMPPLDISDKYGLDWDLEE